MKHSLKQTKKLDLENFVLEDCGKSIRSVLYQVVHGGSGEQRYVDCCGLLHWLVWVSLCLYLWKEGWLHRACAGSQDTLVCIKKTVSVCANIINLHWSWCLWQMTG
jgi:hypothetical protein